MVACQFLGAIHFSWCKMRFNGQHHSNDLNVPNNLNKPFKSCPPVLLDTCRGVDYRQKDRW